MVEEDYFQWNRKLKSDPIEYIATNGFDFVEGCIIKYVSRYKYKDGLRDLHKARAYLDRLIAREEGEPYTYTPSIFVTFSPDTLREIEERVSLHQRNVFIDDLVRKALGLVQVK